MLPPVIETLLIAGKGEIAARVERSCERMGIALAAGDDPTEAPDGLDLDTLLATATRTGAQAIHPGAASPKMAVALSERVLEARLCFVGPSHDTLVALADKWSMREAARVAGMGVIPAIGPFDGWGDDVSRGLRRADMDHPVIVKPVAGTGGVGVEIAHEEEELEVVFQRCAATAQERFGDGRVFVEQYIPRARELEVTLIADGKGSFASLPEREASLRCNLLPWLIESPSPLFSLQRGGDQLQAGLLESAIEVARTIGLVGVATFEFLVDAHGQTFFLEANSGSPRAPLLTELATDLDLSEVELTIAGGGALPFEGPAKDFGHGMEVLLWAQDAGKAFASTPAALKEIRFPPTPVRKARGEAAVEVGQSPSEHAPLLARIATLAPIRHQALLQADRFLAESTLLPGPHSLEAVRKCLGHESLRAGQYDQEFLARRFHAEK